MEEFDPEGPDLYHFASLHGAQVCFGKTPVASQFDLDQAAGQRGGVDGGLDVVQQVVDGANVVLVPVGNDNATHPLPVLAQEGHIRDDVIDPEHVIFREHHTGVDHQQLPPKLINHHIAANFTQAAKGNNS